VSRNEPTESHTQPVADLEERLSGPAGDEVLHRLVAGEVDGRLAGLAELMRDARHAEPAWHQQAPSGEGLRERKRRLTRQLISDVATVMFAIRGFDSVKVSEVAQRVGVSEKTVYNYFPTKESLVLDTADERIERLATALRERGPRESPTAAVVRTLKEELAPLAHAPDELVSFIPRFAEMVNGSPALRAAWLEVHDRLAAVAREELALLADVDPDAPEATIAGRGLAALAEVGYESQRRHAAAGLRGPALLRAVNSDLDRAGRLLETGLWSFALLARGAGAKQQAVEAARAAQEARDQVVRALRHAHAIWHRRDRTGPHG
jgi:AcrR family transcriptional regulator